MHEQRGHERLHRGLPVCPFAAADKPCPLANPPTDFLRDLGLIARIRGEGGGDLGLHMAAAPIEQQHPPVAGREGKSPFLLIKEICGRDSAPRRAPTANSVLSALLGC